MLLQTLLCSKETKASKESLKVDHGPTLKYAVTKGSDISDVR